ncbi:DUF4268 domain-containing protein [Amycolatopsis vastitatis]|uniref:DUF4268 domain-containing protein n=1 Tax=Amycolatopsis vastitatis TaxID=1905142 RepID=A0A229TCR8_9PSEU|nr:DUF4268 domain-containing protein [Amycolatopsis vastitatis]OXM69046.1 hypothetical protein CF165_10090 [Amycolatopsis vastitatis]
MVDSSVAADSSTWTTGGFVEFQSNLDYARDLIGGGRHLERLQVGAFDVADLYRAAWVQAVSALDHWIHRELYDRALGFALTMSAQSPPKFLKLRIPLSLFEDTRRQPENLHVAFAAYLRDQFGWQSFQAPEKIKDALSHVSDVPLWQSVAGWISHGRDKAVSPSQVQEMLQRIVNRRNKIAHEADRDPERTDTKRSITADEASEAIDTIHLVASAIIRVIGPPPVTPELSGEDDPDESAVAVTGSPKSVLYGKFWSRFVPMAKERGWSKAAPATANWFQMPSGIGGVNWVVSFSMFGCRSELYFGDPDGARNLSRWRVLADRRDEITDRFGEDLIFDDLPKKVGCRIEARLLGPAITDEDHWADVLRWMVDTQTRLRKSIGDLSDLKDI